MKQNWYEIKITIDSLASDAISEFLLSKGAFGLAIQDDFEFFNLLHQAENQYLISENDFLPLDNSATIKAYYPEDEQGICLLPRLREEDNPYQEIDKELYNFQEAEWVSSKELQQLIEEKIAELASYFPINTYKVELSKVKEEDWANNWKKYYKPIEINDKLLISPTWENVSLKEGQLEIKLDPGSAFGTGSHETTNLCLKTLTFLDLANKKILDVGCGSGILSIASEKLGAEKILACDLDPQAIKVSEENSKLNSCSKITTFVGSTSMLISSKEKCTYDILIANIISEILISLQKDFSFLLKENGYLLLSGIIKSKLPKVLEVFSEEYQLIEQNESNEWVSLLYKKVKLN